MRMRTAPPDVDVCNQLVLTHVGLVKALASRLAQRVPSHIELNELVSVGMMGLVEAARRFQPSLGVPFDGCTAPRSRRHGRFAAREDWAPRRCGACAAKSTARLPCSSFVESRPPTSRSPEALSARRTISGLSTRSAPSTWLQSASSIRDPTNTRC
jgi:hypothetical protein